MSLRVAAVGDIHSPRYLDLFIKAMSGLPRVDVFLLVGDVVLKGKIEELPKVLDIVERNTNCPIVACFGNEEYEDLHDEIRRLCEGRATFLEEEIYVLQVGDVTLGIVGSKGSLDRPTWWQARNIPNIRKIYAERVKKVADLVSRLKTTYKCLMIHYAPSYCNLEGEKPSAYPELGSKKFEPIIKKSDLDFVVHGHAHRGKAFCEVGDVPVFNVALPATKKITIIDLPLKGETRLDMFFR